MKSFLSQVAANVLQQLGWSELGKTTLVLQSRRAGLILKDELLRLQRADGQAAVMAPQVMTLNELFDSLSTLHAEDELKTICRLYRLYKHHTATTMTLDQFYGWGRQMLADFGSVDYAMPSEEVKPFFENTIAAHELSQWELDAELEARLRQLLMPGAEDRTAEAQSMREQYRSLWENMYLIYSELHEELQTEHRGYDAMRYRHVVEMWDDVQPKTAGRHYVFVGFNYLLPAERQLMDLLCDQSLYYWDYVPDFQTNKKAFSFAHVNRLQLGNALEQERWQGAHPVTAVECISHSAQAGFVHEWLRENYTEDGQKVGVVICDEQMLEPVIYSLPALDKPINITKGFPMASTDVYAACMRWLSDRRLGPAESPAKPELLERMLHEVVEHLEISLAQDTADTEDGEDWKTLLLRESLFQMRCVISQFRQLMTDPLMQDVEWTLRLLRRMLARYMQSRSLPFHGEPLTDVQIMGVLETRMLDFDKLLLLSVEEGVVPQQSQDISFIPYYLRKSYHMQTRDERATVYAYNFFRLLSRAQEVTLLFASPDSKQSKGMSRFLMQMLVSPEWNVTKCRLTESATLAPVAMTSATESTTSLRSLLQVDSQGRLCRGDKLFSLSPTAIQTYLGCRYHFYLKCVLGLKGQEKQGAVLAANEIGTMVHEAICFLYGRLGVNSKSPVCLKPGQLEALAQDDAKLTEALYYGFGKLKRDEDVSMHDAELLVAKSMLRHIIARDITDARDNKLEICLMEKDCYTQIPVQGENATLAIGGTIDRLDRLTDAATKESYLRVVDYKSGAYKETKMSATDADLFVDHDKHYVVQTLIYSEAVCAHLKDGEYASLRLQPNLYFCQRDLNENETTVSLNGQPVNDYTQVRSSFLEQLSATAAEILRTTSFPRSEDRHNCKYCVFSSLCPAGEDDEE